MNAAGRAAESEALDGGVQLSRHIDFATAEIDNLARVWIRMQRERKALDQQGAPDEIVQGFDKLERRASTLLTRSLRRHPLWPWLSQSPGLGGAHTALIIGRIGDPRRFPGQRCTEGHYLPAVYPAGVACPVVEKPSESDGEFGDGQEFGAADQRSEIESLSGCPGVLLPPRPHTGVRSLWHWAGLHADAEGRAPRRRKGVQSDWEARVRASVMQPGGIAEQIVRLNVPHYANVYRVTKARLALRVPDASSESERIHGHANQLRAADVQPEIDSGSGRPLRLFEADRIARKVAAKAFLGDLLIEWKRIAS